MKKFFFVLTIMVVAIFGRSLAQSSIQSKGSEIIFLMEEEPYCTIHFDLVSLAELAAQSDTIVDEEGMRFMDSYPYPDAGPDEPAFLVLLPDDGEINVILIQEDEDGMPISLRMFTSVGWMEYYEDEDDGSYPGALGDFMAMVYSIRHLDEVGR